LSAMFIILSDWLSNHVYSPLICFLNNTHSTMLDEVK
jgi:hypothetical protein